METSRLFIAAELDSSVKEQLMLIQNQLKKCKADVKWVRPENIHLTLKFLGDTPNDQIDPLINILRESAKGFPAFNFTLNHLGAFPKLEDPQIIWIGIEENLKRIQDMVVFMEEKLEKMGFKREERKFSPHITLGRLRSPDNRLLLSKAICDYNMPRPLRQKIKDVTLFQSTLTCEGPTYKILEKARLKDS